MKAALPETIYIYNNLLNDEQKSIIGDFLKNVQVNNKRYDPTSLWIMDKKIGGIGGYCMPADPRINPFPGGAERELFRPLQYARSEVDICDIRIHARHVVHYSGMHLEAVLRLYLSRTKRFGNLRFFNSTLGKAAYEIDKINVFDKTLIGTLFKFITLYNKAKHEVNMLKDRQRLFSVADALVCYFSARIIGQTVLAEIQYPASLNTYDIDNNVYSF